MIGKFYEIFYLKLYQNEYSIEQCSIHFESVVFTVRLIGLQM